MRDHELETTAETKSRQSQQADTTLNRATASQPSQAGHSLLQLQRQYGNRYVQRVLAIARKTAGNAEVSPEIDASIQRARGGGRALDSGIRSQMGTALRADFSSVRVHTDAKADMLNRALNARAFTTGQDIFFRQGTYSPGSSSGRELLAHELTHVVQQNGDKVQTKLSVSHPSDKYEQEADRVAHSVMQQEQQATPKATDTGLVHRQADDEEESVQTKLDNTQVQRMEEDEDESVQTKAEDTPVQRMEEEDEETSTS